MEVGGQAEQLKLVNQKLGDGTYLEVQDEIQKSLKNNDKQFKTVRIAKKLRITRSTLTNPTSPTQWNQGLATTSRR